MISRRGLISGLATLIAAPAIVRSASLMPVHAFTQPYDIDELCELLSARIDAAKRVMEQNMARSIFEYKGEPIIDTPYLRAGGPDRTLVNHRSRYGWDTDKPAIVKAYMLHG